MSTAPMLKFLAERCFFVVETDPQNPNHHNLHTTTAKHLLALCPKEGDRVVGSIRARFEYAIAENWHQRLVAIGLCPVMRLASGAFEVLPCVGRSAMLGEDSLDSAPNWEGLLREVFASERAWNYTPVAVVPRGSKTVDLVDVLLLPALAADS